MKLSFKNIVFIVFILCLSSTLVAAEAGSEMMQEYIDEVQGKEAQGSAEFQAAAKKAPRGISVERFLKSRYIGKRILYFDAEMTPHRGQVRKISYENDQLFFLVYNKGSKGFERVSLYFAPDKKRRLAHDPNRAYRSTHKEKMFQIENTKQFNAMLQPLVANDTGMAGGVPSMDFLKDFEEPGPAKGPLYKTTYYDKRNKKKNGSIYVMANQLYLDGRDQLPMKVLFVKEST